MNSPFEKAKTLEDFPKFVVTAVRTAGVSKEGHRYFDIEGNYEAILENRLSEIVQGNGPLWFWLLFGERGCLCPMVKSLDKKTRTAVLTADSDEEPKVLGQALAYLSPYWQAFNVWMVRDPDWGWQRRRFQGTDAIAEDYEAKDVSIVDGREVKVWTKLEPVGISGGQSRYYPAENQTLPVRSASRLIAAAWGHEHCALCHKHIDVGTFGYCDPDDRWMCESCYERYVSRRDLAFVDEL